MVQRNNVLIEKDPGYPWINRLRIIHLFEADFNFFLKLQWGHRLVRQACDLDLLHSGQHGSVPRRTSLDPIMLTQLTTDLCRILKHDFARFDNDASSCYDRIIVALGMLAARRCGMPTKAIRLHADALRLMKYTVKTIHGISEDKCHGTAYAPIFGTGQGSGASPSVWLTLVVLMLNTLDRIVPDRINFVPVQGQRNHSRHVDAFVDDTSLGLTSAGYDSDNHRPLHQRLDQDVLTASLAAAAKVKKFGEPSRSVELAEARKQVVVLKKHLSALRTHYDHSSVLTREMAQLATPVPLPPTPRECSVAIRKVESTIKEIIAESYERRDHERQRKLEALETSGKKADKESATRLRHMKKAEDIKQLFRKISGVRKNKLRQGVTRIEIPLHPEHDPKTCTEWRQIDVPTEIVRLLQEQNRNHFGQAKGTPFTVAPLLDDLGFCGDQPLSTRILDGTYQHQSNDDDDVSKNVRLLLQYMTQVHEMAVAPSFPTISMDDFMNLPADELTPEFRRNRDELDMMQHDLRTLHLTLLNYALERGYSYKRWQTIANTILFKDQDNVRLHRTRVIHIYEADFNLALGIKWRIQMYQAEALAALNDGQ
ncbi:hypothetical protein MHU86_21605 [Fragilaria crotonensis]|nr:hypothetical protein MHU86_21605 [Fragilaria crotonensis]